MTLESLPKIANTKCLQTKETALSLVVRELEVENGPSFLSTLISELEDCRAGGIDSKAMEVDVQNLRAQLCQLEQRRTAPAFEMSMEPPCLQQARLAEFLTYAQPQLEALEGLVRDLGVA